MAEQNLKEGTWDPSRVLDALGRIGYHPVAAILDIVDNSVSAMAANIHVDLELGSDSKSGKGRRRAFLAAVSVVDDGIGMSLDGLHNAISLGSSTEHYAENTLSKFGMGLKAASMSLGRRCKIVSRQVGFDANVAILDHDRVSEEQKYVYELRGATDDELAALNEVCGEGSGTLVEITKIANNLPSPSDIRDALNRRIGVTYFYALVGESTGYPQINLFVDGEGVDAVDPLFEAEIADGDAGDLDERAWDGRTVKFIERRKPIQLTADGTVSAHVTMTQLPHPPSVAHHTGLSSAIPRNQYRISAGNYGFYIYRNGRLIGWAESLGMVKNDQDLYSFRGRLEITEGADDVLNLDVTKSRIQLSEIANTQLKPLVGEALKKSRTAWQYARDEMRRLTDGSPHSTINEELDRVANLEDREDEFEDSVEPLDEQERRKSRRDNSTRQRKAKDEEGDQVRERAERVQYVEMLENNQLWERAHHPQHGMIVRVNRSHRMFRDILEPQLANAQLVQAFDLLLFALARGEYTLVYKSDKPQQEVEELVDEYREHVGQHLSEIVRRLDADRLSSA